MTGYAIGRFRSVERCAAIITYLERIDATLAPFGGRFLIHGQEKVVLEGEWQDDLVVIAFPDLESARTWYDSPAYREILPLRLAHADGDVFIAGDVGRGHRATDILLPAAGSTG